MLKIYLTATALAVAAAVIFVQLQTVAKSNAARASIETGSIERAKLRSTRYCNRTATLDRYACLAESAAKGSYRSDEFLPAYKALATMQLIQAVASPQRQFHWAAVDGLRTPSSVEQYICLDEGFGICGNHMLLFVEIMKRAGVAARTVEIYYSANGQNVSHAAAEFLFDGQWRFVDVTWGTIWLGEKDDLKSWLSAADVFQAKGHRVTSNLDLGLQSNLLAGTDAFGYVSAKSDLVIGGAGNVTIEFEQDVGDLKHRPSFIGDNRQDGAVDKLAMVLRKSSTATAGIVVQVAGVGGYCRESWIALGDKRLPVKVGMAVFDGETGGELRIEGSEDLCYAVVASVRRAL